MRAIAADIASTDATPEEGLRLMNIAALESNFDRHVTGHHGEQGAFQVMPPARSYGADEALRRMRRQGMAGFVGCRHAEDVVTIGGRRMTCQQMIDHRVEKAEAFRMAFDPPTLEGYGELAGNP